MKIRINLSLAGPSGNHERHRMKYSALLLLIATLLSGCTSTVAIGTAYNSAAKTFSNRLADYAEFNNRQQREIKKRVSAFHQWHREQHLPAYQRLLQQLALSTDAPELLEKQSVDQWVSSFRALLLQTGQCNPLNNSNKLLSSLSDRQVQQISVTLRDKQIQRALEYQSETSAERLDRRQTAITKWAKRAGIKFTDEQSMLLNSTLSKQISLSPQRHQLWQNWSDRFVQLMRKRDQTSFAVEVDQHIASLWNLSEQTYPEQWQTNVTLWADFLYQFLKTQTPEQSRKLKKKLNAVANSLEKLSLKKSSQQPQCFGAN